MQCATVLLTKKVKASHPHNRVTFTLSLLWSRIQSINHRGWEKIREWFSPIFSPLPSFIFLERVQVHCLCGQPKFTFHHKASLASLICLGNKIVDLDKLNCSSFDLKFSCSYNKMMLIWIELGRWLFAGLYSAEWQHTFVAGGEDSKRFVMGQASVNNLRSRGVKGHGSCIPWNIVKAALGLQAGCTLRYLSEIL